MERLKAMHEQLNTYIKANWHKSFNEPTGILKHRFLDPAAVYRAQLWDWDSFFCGMGLLEVYEETADYVKGCALNFLDLQRKDGSIPYMITVSEDYMEALPEIKLSERDENSDLNSMKPLLAQMCVMAGKKLSDFLWIKENYEKLRKHIIHWEETQQIKNGLFVWRSYRGSGTDNHPALYGRPLNSSVGVELNCFMYKEYQAMAEISEICNDEEMKKIYTEKAQKLAEAINEHMWDPIDEIYYHLDAMSQKPPLARQDVFWDIPLKFKTWTSFMPMYAGIAPKEYAEKLVKKHLLNREEFWSDYGLRTLAKNEPVYNLVETSNPSNWQGPVWIVSTWLMFKGLLNYGYLQEAKQVAENLLGNLCRDLEENGALHEYYNPESGNSHINLGFMNWNALAGIMVPELLKCYEM